MDSKELIATLDSINNRLAALEIAAKKEAVDRENCTTQTNLAGTQNNNGDSTDQRDDPDQQEGVYFNTAQVRDHLRDFDQIRKRLAKVSIPPHLKVNDNAIGIKI